MEYWPSEFNGATQKCGVDLSFRGELALRFVHHFGLIAAIQDGEDSQGRAKTALLKPKELVGRCFDIADEFIKVCEDRQLIKVSSLTYEQLAEHEGILAGISSDMRFSGLKPKK